MNFAILACGVLLMWKFNGKQALSNALFLICRFSSLRLMRFVHFNVNWLDFVFIGAKIEFFFFCAWEKNWIFLENVIFAIQTDELWNPTTILKKQKPQWHRSRMWFTEKLNLQCHCHIKRTTFLKAICLWNVLGNCFTKN